MEKVEFRPARAFRRTLPAAIFLSLLATAYLPPWVRALPLISFGLQMLNTFGGLCVVVLFGAMTVLSSPLAVVDAMRTQGHTSVRWTLLLFNAVACLVWFGIVGWLLRWIA